MLEVPKAPTPDLYDIGLPVQLALMQRMGEALGKDERQEWSGLEWTERYGRAFGHLWRTNDEFMRLVIEASEATSAEKAGLLDRVQSSLDAAIEHDPSLLEDEFSKPGKASHESPKPDVPASESTAHPA